MKMNLKSAKSFTLGSNCKLSGRPRPEAVVWNPEEVAGVGGLLYSGSASDTSELLLSMIHDGKVKSAHGVFKPPTDRILT